MEATYIYAVIISVMEAIYIYAVIISVINVICVVIEAYTCMFMCFVYICATVKTYLSIRQEGRTSNSLTETNI
jgi:hypothetical protein